MTGLLGPNGRPISSKSFQNKKAAPPELGEQYGAWSGPQASLMSLPGGGAIQFDLNSLTMADYRQMRDHYQINSSLSVLMFLLHQLEWRLIGDDKKMVDEGTEQLEGIWTPLVRSLSTAFWSGYSPNILQWENDVANRRIVLDKIKDLVPEDCQVKWKSVDGKGSHKVNIYDGITQFGAPPVPVANSFWYPLLMENGNYYGRKLLRSAFQPWFFSILMHLFANRYYERFGEPTPIGRAPYDEDIRFNGADMSGNQAMEMILQSLRNRSTVVLPNDKTAFGDETTLDYDYQIEYLESQMRGADFERYMTRLDEEISLALFTPILMMRTADVGSYNLGTQHNQTYKLMLNAISGDWERYINKYILAPINRYNSPRGENAAPLRIKFRKLGSENDQLIRDMVQAMVAKGSIKPDIEQLGEMAGIKLSVVRELKSDPAPEGDDEDSSEGSSDDSTGSPATENGASVYRVVGMISERIAPQIANAFKRGFTSETQFSFGYEAKMRQAMESCGIPNPERTCSNFYESVNLMLAEANSLDYDSPEEYMRMLNHAMNFYMDGLLQRRAA